jgi:hypothetical protein
MCERADAFSHAGLRRRFIHAMFLPLLPARNLARTAAREYSGNLTECGDLAETGTKSTVPDELQILMHGVCQAVRCRLAISM